MNTIVVFVGLVKMMMGGGTVIDNLQRRVFGLVKEGREE
jgi:hypothetical protein